MDSGPQDLDLWIRDALHHWVDEEQLPPDKSVQLHKMVIKLARQERKRRWLRTALSFAAALIACLLLLFTNCPVAAAAYLGVSITAGPGPLSELPISFAFFMLIMVGNYLRGFHYPYVEVYYE